MTSLVDDFIAPPCHEPLGVLYEDAHIVLINKPSGLLSLSGKNPLNVDSVHYRLVKSYPTATLVHRLDFGTSGIMLVALSKAVNALLTKQFQARSIQKCYIAFLNGWLEEDEGLISCPIAKGSFPRQKICVVEGKPAQSRFRVLERLSEPKVSKVEFTPITGRTHQLRIHSREVGHSILGCDLYASQQVCDMADRLMLHAYSLAFDHPVSGERMQIISDLSPFSDVNK